MSRQGEPGGASPLWKKEAGVTNEELGFSYDTTGIDRDQILAAAAVRVDAIEQGMGELPPVLSELPAPTEAGNLLRDLKSDRAEFAGFPEIYRITDKSFLKADVPVPVAFSQLAKRYNFYWVYFPLVLFPAHNAAFNRLELAVKFSASAGEPHLQPKAYQILPNQQFQTLIEANQGAEVRLDEQLQFQVKPVDINTPLGGAGGSVAAKAAGQAGLVVGPFVYKVKRAKIQHTAPGAESVFWRLDGAEFFQEDAPEFIVVVQVPKEAKEVRVQGELAAYRSFNFFSAGLRDAISQLSGGVGNWLRGGAPVSSTASYDLTPRL
jgi:hypothetical protein